MSTDTPDPRLRAALTLVDSPYLERRDESLFEEDRDSLDLIARIMSEFHALAPTASRRGEPRFRWGPLDVFEEIGRGSFGVVHFARDPRLDLDIALKLQPLDDDGDAHAIIAEARRLARVRHVNVCTVLGVDVHDGQVGLWTDHVPGRTLASRLDDGPLSVPETIRVGTQLARALHAVHACDLVHGDVTANNVIECPDGRIVLTDFGSSIVRAAGHAALIPRTGTPLAMAPELFAGGSLSPASDIYALGALLFRLLTGEHVVGARDVDEIARAHRMADRRSLTAYRKDVPAPLLDVITRATAFDPEERHPSASALLDALSTSGVPPHNLPEAGSTFVGREEDVAAIRAALATGRLVTLTGVGGVGKTRLATELARDELHSYPDGVWLVELDDVAESEGVPAAVLRACGLSSSAKASQEAVVAAFEHRRLLLLLDNCEREAAAVAELAAGVIARAPGVTILCTSRVALGVPGELVYAVLPLPVAADGVEPSAAERLFLDRLPPSAAAETSAERSATVARICRHVDGIPLALELASARASSLDLAELERRLERHLAVLSARGATRPERHRTMSALVAWSVDLLDDDSRAALTVLGVFPGSFVLDAAEEILAATAPDISDPLSTLIRLVDDSLVERRDAHDGGSTTRYRLLVPVRQFAVSALDGCDDALRARDAFHDWYARLAIDASESQRSKEDSLEIIDADYHNIRPALDACFESPYRRSTAYRLVLALFDYWWERTSRSDAWDALQRVLRDEPQEVTPSLARLRYLSGMLGWTRGDLARAQLDFEHARSHSRELELELEESKALSGLGHVVARRAVLEENHERLEEAAAMIEESVLGYRKAGDPVREAEAYNNIGTSLQKAGLHAEARAYFERALKLLRGPSSLRVRSGVLGNLARLDELTGDMSAASARLVEAGEAARRAADSRTVAYCLLRRGDLLATDGDVDAAVPLLEEGIGLARRVKSAYVEACAHLPLARCDTQVGDRSAALDHVLACVRFVIAPPLPFRGRDELIALTIREAGFVAAFCESWTCAAWMLSWSADYLERQQRALGPHERTRFARASERLSAAVGPMWRDAGRKSMPALAEDALTRARDELEALVAQLR